MEGCLLVGGLLGLFVGFWSAKEESGGGGRSVVFGEGQEVGLVFWGGVCCVGEEV